VRTDPGYDGERNMVLRNWQERGGETRASCEVYIAATTVEQFPTLPWDIANLLNRAAFYRQVEVPAHVTD